MSTPAQIQANRTNAQKSTGPRTPDGKAVVSQNALKHGLLARHAVIVGEDQGEFEFYRDQMLAELAPEGQMESTLAHRAVGLAWRLQRAERLQNEAFDALYTEETTNPLRRLMRHPFAGKREEPAPEPGRDPALGRIIVKDFANTRVLDRLLMYERRLEHSLYKTIAELQRLRLLREETGDWYVPSPSEGCTCPRFPDRAKQTQFQNSQTRANQSQKNDLRPGRLISPPPKQTQSNPISPSPRGRRYPNRIPQPSPGGSKRPKAPVYSMPNHAGREPKHPAGAVTDLR
jgi:hypothetical protein